MVRYLAVIRQGASKVSVEYSGPVLGKYSAEKRRVPETSIGVHPREKIIHQMMGFQKLELSQK